MSITGTQKELYIINDAIVPNHLKDDILLVLKDIFNISAQSIYYESNGHADLQGKFKRIIGTKSTTESFNKRESDKQGKETEYSRYIKSIMNLMKGDIMYTIEMKGTMRIA